MGGNRVSESPVPARTGTHESHRKRRRVRGQSGNLELTAEESGRMVRDLNSILGYIDNLNQLDTSRVEPMAQVSDRYGVDPSKQGSERFAYASRQDVHEGLRKSLRA